MRLSEIERFANWGMCVKFVGSDNLDDLLNGEIYMSPVQKFIDQELKEKIRGQGDKDEAAHVYGVQNVRLISEETGDVFATAAFATVRESSPVGGKIPVFCFTKFTANDFEVYEYTENYIKFGLAIPKEEEDEFLSKFGNKAVILPSNFVKRIIEVVDVTDDFCLVADAKYSDSSIGIVKQRKEDFDEGRIDLVLWKDIFFKYQREVRFTFSTRLTDVPFKYGIGSIRADSIVKDTKDFFNGYFDVYLNE